MTLKLYEPSLQSPQRDKKRIWYFGGTWLTPNSRGVMSMSSGATGLATEKFWRMVVKKRNNSALAILSPIQMRLPVDTEDHNVNLEWMHILHPEPRYLCPLHSHCMGLALS